MDSSPSQRILNQKIYRILKDLNLLGNPQENKLFVIIYLFIQYIYNYHMHSFSFFVFIYLGNVINIHFFLYLGTGQMEQLKFKRMNYG